MGLSAGLIAGAAGGVGAATPEAKPEAKEAWLGVYTQTLTPELSEGLNYKGSGALVNRVVEGSPAEKAGVKKGDVIVGLNTTTIASATDLTKAVGGSKVDQTVSVRIIREGERRTLSAKLVERPAEEMEWSSAPEAPGEHGDFEFMFDDAAPGFAMFRGGRGRLGVRVEDLNSDLGSYFGVTDGKGALVVEVLKDTPAEKAGVKAGDVITKVGAKVIENSDDLVQALRAAEKKVTLTVRRKNAVRTIESELRESPRVMRYRYDHDAPFAWKEWKDGGIRVRVNDDDMRKELDELRKELRELKTKVEGKN
jgi:serine protease Do